MEELRELFFSLFMQAHDKYKQEKWFIDDENYFIFSFEQFIDKLKEYINAQET